MSTHCRSKVYTELCQQGVIVPAADFAPPVVPQDLDAAKKAGKVCIAWWGWAAHDAHSALGACNALAASGHRGPSACWHRDCWRVLPGRHLLPLTCFYLLLQVRAPTHIVSTICDDRGEEPTYAGVPMSELMEMGANVGDAIGWVFIFCLILPSVCFQWRGGPLLLGRL